MPPDYIMSSYKGITVNLKLVLRLLGLRSHNLLSSLLSLAFTFGSSTLSEEISHVLHTRITPARRVELITSVRGIADNMEKGNDDAVAQAIVTILQGIRL